uniref:Integrase core domain containing protein n=1 Tax=Solanum tuberosum TaxID=4113 RepID=M1E0M7_SOLTU
MVVWADTPPQSEEGGGSSDNGEDSESQSDVVAGSQFADSSGGSAKSASGSPEDTNTSPSVGNTEVETGPNPALRPQLIACYRSMWIVNRSEEFFNNGIVNKTGSFKKWTIMPETRVSKIKDVVNHLFGAKSAAVGTLAVVHHVPLEIPQTDKCTKQGESSQLSTDVPPPPVSAPRLQIVIRMPQLIETKVLAAKKEIQDKMRKELVVLKDRMDGLENIVQDRCQAACSVEFEEFKSQLAEMRTQIAKLAEKPVQVPTPIMLESLMQMLTQAPSTQSIDDLWGEIPTSKFDKRKHKTRELDEETPIDPVREAKRQEKRARRTSKREAREKETLEQQQRDASLVGASSNGAPARTCEDQPDQVPSSESTPIDKGVNVDSKTGA